jgi:hypothetical protein
MRSVLTFFAASAILASALLGEALASEVVKLSRQRILLSDVLPDAAESLATIDLGPAPPPGKSRLLSHSDISYRLKALGIAASQLEIPKEGIRVESVARVFTPSQLEQLVRPALVGTLPEGFVLRSLHVSADWVLSPEVAIGAIDLAPLATSLSCKGGPKRPLCRETVLVDLSWGNEVVARLPVQLELDVSRRAEEPPVPRGSVISLSVFKGNVEVTVLAETMASAKVGEVVMLRAQATKKVMSARLVSSSRAEVAL